MWLGCPHDRWARERLITTWRVGRVQVFHASSQLASIRSVDEAVVIGVALSLSSSAFVLQLLAERGETNSKFGSATLGILLMQARHPTHHRRSDLAGNVLISRVAGRLALSCFRHASGMHRMSRLYLARVGCLPISKTHTAWLLKRAR